jgi:hypothetical protein
MDVENVELLLRFSARVDQTGDFFLLVPSLWPLVPTLLARCT